jgi:tetratricopeptide (TPR) repeat protein
MPAVKSTSEPGTNTCLAFAGRFDDDGRERPMVTRRSEAKGETPSEPNRAQTLDLCARLASYGEAGAAPSDLLRRVGAEATRRFGDDVEVLIAVGRMYLMGEELAEAEKALRRATRLAPQDPHALRLLGEVLLRQGDPTAAHAALSSAVACGMNDPWTKTWVARALDYSELEGDLGREGIARDVRQVLGRPGQGPPDERRELPSAPPRETPTNGPTRPILGCIDKGIFFAGDPRAEPDSRPTRPYDLPEGEIVDLPTPAAGGVSHHALGVEGAARRGAEGSALADALGDDAAWGGPPSSDSMPASDTEISTWVPEMHAPARRSAPPVQTRGSEPPPGRGSDPGRIAPLPPAMPRLSAGELFDEFTENRKPYKLPPGAPEPKAAPARAPEPKAAPARASEPAPAQGENRRGPPPLPPEPPRAGPPPLPRQEAAIAASIMATGKSPALPDDWVPARRPEVAPKITIIGADEPAPVTAPPSALMPLDPRAEPPSQIANVNVMSLREPPMTAPPSALIPLDPGQEGPSEVANVSAVSLREPPTAPPSALLPPEPPSLQVPSKLLLGGGLKPPASVLDQPSRGEPGAAPAAEAKAPAVAAAKKKKPRSRLQSVLLRAAAALAVAAVLAGGAQLYKRNRSTKIRTFTAQAAIALHAGGPRGVADAEAALASARRIDAKSRVIALATLRARFFAVIDVDPARLPDLVSAMDDASALGVSSSDMAFAAVTRAAFGNDAAGAAEMVSHHDQDPERATDPLYQLAAGVALEPQDAPAAIERYRAAVKLDSDLLSAEIRLTRALAFSDRLAEARVRLPTLEQKWPGRSELVALSAIVAAADRAAPPGAAKLDPAIDVDMLPRPLRAAARALAKGGDEAAVSKATSEADVAPVLVLCGEAALRAGHEASAREAAQRAIEISPSYAPAYSLVARVALAAGRFEESRQAALRAPPDVASEVLSFLAYENGDVAAMTSAAGRRANGSATDPVTAGLERLRGAAPLAPATIGLLAKSSDFWADIVAMDAALDAGDLDAAQKIAAGWPGADKHPIRSARVARLLRYQGKNGAAQTAAASAAPTLAARIEAALSAAEMASARDAAVAALSSGRTPEEKWALALLYARDGRGEPAHAAMHGLALPGADAPLQTRVVAALALVELHTKNPTAPLWQSLDPWAHNPDVARALGIAPAAPAPGDGAAPEAPAKPVLKGRLPKKDDEVY